MEAERKTIESSHSYEHLLRHYAYMVSKQDFVLADEQANIIEMLFAPDSGFTRAQDRKRVLACLLDTTIRPENRLASARTLMFTVNGTTKIDKPMKQE